MNSVKRQSHDQYNLPCTAPLRWTKQRTHGQHHESPCECSSRMALATVDRNRSSSLTSWTFARAVSNSLNKSTHLECLPHFSTMNLTTSRFSMQRLFSICDISLVGFTCKLGSSQTVNDTLIANAQCLDAKYWKHDLAERHDWSRFAPSWWCSLLWSSCCRTENHPRHSPSHRFHGDRVPLVQHEGIANRGGNSSLLLGLYPRAFAQGEQVTTNDTSVVRLKTRQNSHPRTDRTGDQSIELNSPQASGTHTSLTWQKESPSSNIGLVVEHPPVSFVALVSFASLVHLPSLCDSVGLSVGGVMGPIRLLRRPLPLVSVFLPFWYGPHTLIGIVLLLGWPINTPRKTFPQPCSNRTFSNCLTHNSPARGWPYKFLSRGTPGFSMSDHDLGHLCFDRRIQISGHSDFGILNKDGAFSILTWV